MEHFETIVIGAGGVGSAALFHLARRGVKAVALDRFAPPHDRGSSHGQTRIIRQAYFEHPDYVPLARLAYQRWAELEELCGQRLYHEIGLLEVGPPDSQVIRGVRTAAEIHGLTVESLTSAEIHRRFAGLHAPDAWVGVYEPHAGCLLVEACVAAHLAAAQRLGGSLRTGVAVLGWRIDGPTAIVETDAGPLAAQRLVIVAGPWAASLLADLAIRLEVRRKPQFWYPGDDRRYRADGGCPAFLFDAPEGIFYGIPALESFPLRVAEHSRGALVPDPLAVDRRLHADDQRRIEQFLAACLPALPRRLVDHSVCMYTMSPDEHFLVDRHPRHPQVVFAAGLSGHGFKFACVLGEALADLACDGTTAAPIGFLRLDRPTLRAAL